MLERKWVYSQLNTTSPFERSVGMRSQRHPASGSSLPSLGDWNTRTTSSVGDYHFAPEEFDKNMRDSFEW